MLDLLWLLLPVAAISGWAIAKQQYFPSFPAVKNKTCTSDYFRGINYLLNEQPDKAIEVFTRMIEVNRETVEMHFALGSLFRRRGEVERAIRIHQNLIARATLTPPQRTEALLELGKDYQRAGLLDRAENLFRELIDMHLREDEALQCLRDIYQQEKEWKKAIQVARKLEQVANVKMDRVIAHYCCELAESARRQGNEDPGKYINEAFQWDANCARASILRGNLLMSLDRYEDAIAAFAKVALQDSDYISEVIDPMLRCYIQLERGDKMLEYLQTLPNFGGEKGLTVISELINQKFGDEEAISFLSSYLNHCPSLLGLSCLINLTEKKSTGMAEPMGLFKTSLDKLIEKTPQYQCDQCGFSGKVLHWLCPTCKYWGTVKPFRGQL